MNNLSHTERDDSNKLTTIVRKKKMNLSRHNRSVTATNEAECKNNMNDVLAPHICQKPCTPSTKKSCQASISGTSLHKTPVIPPSNHINKGVKTPEQQRYQTPMGLCIILGICFVLKAKSTHRVSLSKIVVEKNSFKSIQSRRQHKGIKILGPLTRMNICDT